MAYYVPQMQQRYTGYDSGQNTARNLLDAVRMKNEKEASDRRLNIAETQADNMQKLFKQDQETRKLRNKAFIGRAKDRQQAEDLKKRMAQSGTGGSLPYRTAQWITDYLNPFTESRNERKIRESGGRNQPSYRLTPEDLEGTDADISSVYPFLFGRENLLQQMMMQNQGPAYTQTLNFNPATGTYE